MDPADATGELVLLAVSGSEEAWGTLVATHAGLLRATGRRFRLREDEVSDAVQATWLALFTHLDTVRDPARITGWLLATMRRECLKVLNRRRREGPTVDGLHDAIHQGVHATAVDASLLAAERAVLLRAALDQLAPRQRRLLLMLSATPPPSYQEVARALSISIGTVGPMRQNALRRLRVLLADLRRDGALDLSA